MNFIHPTIIVHFIISINIIVLCTISFINPFYEYGFISKGWQNTDSPSWIAMGHMGMGGLSVDFSGIFHEINFHICIPFLLGHPRNLDLMDPRWVDFSGIRGDAVSGEAPTLAVHGSLLEVCAACVHQKATTIVLRCQKKRGHKMKVMGM